jgi:hypothetical protein
VIRPEAARWFEIWSRATTFVALEALAMTGTVEIEWRRGTLQQEDAAQVNRLLREYGVLSRRYRAYWPAARLRATSRIAPADALAAAIATIDAWSAGADPVIARLQDAETEIAQLDTVARVMERLRGAPIDFSAIGQPAAAWSRACSSTRRARGSAALERAPPSDRHRGGDLPAGGRRA